MSMKDFESEKDAPVGFVSEHVSERYTYEVPREGDTAKTKYPAMPLGKPVIDEINAWANLIHSLKDGLPKPYDPTVVVDKVMKIQRRYQSLDLRGLINAPPPSAEVREAKEFKPLIFGIIRRIVDIGELGKYIENNG